MECGKPSTRQNGGPMIVLESWAGDREQSILEPMTAQMFGTD